MGIASMHIPPCNSSRQRSAFIRKRYRAVRRKALRELRFVKGREACSSTRKIPVFNAAVPTYQEQSEYW
jgi:hypothetical protein